MLMMGLRGVTKRAPHGSNEKKKILLLKSFRDTTIFICRGRRLALSFFSRYWGLAAFVLIEWVLFFFLFFIFCWPDLDNAWVLIMVVSVAGCLRFGSCTGSSKGMGGEVGCPSECFCVLQSHCNCSHKSLLPSQWLLWLHCSKGRWIMADDA